MLAGSVVSLDRVLFQVSLLILLISIFPALLLPIRFLIQLFSFQLLLTFLCHLLIIIYFQHCTSSALIRYYDICIREVHLQVV
uniref:Uncharacterized protein n=1 Tax=Panstrongylus lignarius TaxID=156445 RepID=A0A224XZH6_9HEMI